jgi:glyoxylase I family protein
MARFENKGLDHIAIAVADPERSRRFYEEVVGLEFVREVPNGPTILGAGGSGMAIFDKDLHPSSTADDVEPPAIRILHIAFRLDRTGFDQAQSELGERGFDTHFSDHGVCHSVYFDDPDGHQIELTTYDV